MPELPEVEVTRRQIAPVLVGARIERVTVGPPSYFFLTPPATLKKRLTGRTFVALRRVGKYLLGDLDDHAQVLFHLGMTGQLHARLLGKIPHVHLALALAGGGGVSFRDARKFGKVELLERGETSARLAKLGPDALSISQEELQEALRKKRAPIKPVLLDQSVLAGVGNIYADEALFRSKIHPERSGAELSRAEVSRLARAVRELLSEAVQAGGSTINDYLQPDGELGGFQGFHRVYGREGEHCSRCRTPIQRQVQRGRSSHFCPKCQPR